MLGPISTKEALISAAKLLRKLHDASASFIANTASDDFHWKQIPKPPFEAICHSDFAPYNVALKGCTVVGVFDFDTAHPGPRIWDLAYAIYCWAPFKTQKYDAMGTLSEQCLRARAFCQHYGATENEKFNLVDCMANRLQDLVNFMLAEADSGDIKFRQDIQMGHHKAYLNDIANLMKNKAQITHQLFA